MRFDKDDKDPSLVWGFLGIMIAHDGHKTEVREL